MAASNIVGDVKFTGGTARFLDTVVIPDGTIVGDKINADADIAREAGRHPIRFELKQSGTPAASTMIVYECRVSAATVSFFRAVQAAKNTSSNTTTIDLKKSTGGGAFATILSAPIVLDSGNTDRVPEAGTISSASLVQGDLLQIVVTASTPDGSGLAAYGEVEELGA